MYSLRLCTLLFYIFSFSLCFAALECFLWSSFIRQSGRKCQCAAREGGEQSVEKIMIIK